MDNSPVIYDLTEQLERIANSLEKITDSNINKNIDSPYQKNTCLSLFLESLPNWRYNSLRRKIIPLGLAAKIIGASSQELLELTNNGQIASNADHYDMLSLLMYLDLESNPCLSVA